ncbi:MAG: hypothetical protein B7Z31_03540 [Rhodobacterales bacterium 12-65-15]|nr:MAG: hypothetical protein B7Z31_03540 [Rhodobacterales bacterium 12-65-15]
MRRRALLVLGTAAVVAAAVGYRLVYPTYPGPEMDAPTAFRLAEAGAVVLVDIRRPDEWAETGSAQGAQRLDLRDPGFVDALTALVAGDRTRPIALICAKGVRSARLANQLTAAGFTSVSNVTEGMLGSSAGPGWIARGLPLNRE